ncbi:BrnA antitoxin family protein [Paracoccus marcusii]|uniref:BrnA antitoxin family protein n=1 Tax=Paracoccus marcusii TaxID=59779 RepID=UPI003264B0A5
MTVTKAEGTRRANYHYMADAMRMLEWDLHSTVMARMRIPDEWHRIAQEKGTAPKTRVTLRLDADVVAFFRSMGPDWQVRVNRLMAAWMPARLAGLIEGAETMDYLKRREAEGLDGPRLEFGDLQHAEDAAWAEMGETPLPPDAPGVPMEGHRRMSAAGKRAFLEEMKGWRGL